MSQSAHIMEERVVVGAARHAWWRWFSVFFWIATISDELAGIYRVRFVLRNLIVTQLKIRYHRSALGFLWTLLNPILMLTVQAVVFSRIVNMDHYSVYLFAGFIPWQFFSSSLDNGSRSMLSSEGMIRKILPCLKLFSCWRMWRCA